MAVFVYRGVLITTGKNVDGVRDADNPKVLRSLLRKEGILLTSAEEDTRAEGGGRKPRWGAFFRDRIGTDDIAMMTRQLATLVRAGIPLVDAVTALTDQVDKLELKRVLTQVRDRLNEGTSLAKSLEPHPKAFAPLYVNMVAAGEASGTLEQVLERLADFMEGQARIRGKVGGALAYPVLMLIIGTIIISVMMTAVVPKVTNIFASLDRALPWYTQVLIAISNTLSSAEFFGFMMTLTLSILLRKAMRPVPPAAVERSRDAKIREVTQKKSLNGFALAAGGVGLFMLASGWYVESLVSYGIGIALGIAAGIAAAKFVAFLATPEGRMWRDRKLLTAPIFGTLFRMLGVSRFARTLATLLQAGVPLLKAMDIVRAVIGNARLEQVVVEAAEAIREGSPIAQTLKRSGDFPPIVVHMIAVGEKSGQLEGMLENVAKAYDNQVETRIGALTSLLEPLIIVMMGGAVGFIAFSILMPLIQMNDFVQ